MPSIFPSPQSERRWRRVGPRDETRDRSMRTRTTSRIESCGSAQLAELRPADAQIVAELVRRAGGEQRAGDLSRPRVESPERRRPVGRKRLLAEGLGRERRMGVGSLGYFPGREQAGLDALLLQRRAGKRVRIEELDDVRVELAGEGDQGLDR